jgi:PAS domain S-box-containing protein
MVSRDHRFEALFDAALDAVFVVGDDRTLVDANPAACELVGAAGDRLLGRRFDDFLPPGTEIAGAWQEFLRAGKRTGELALLRPDGVARHVEYAATAHVLPGRHLAILRDITERKRAEESGAKALRREQRRLRETQTLLAVSRALSSTLDPTETMRRVAREIALALRADMVGAYLADPAHEYLWPTAGYRVPRSMLDAFRRFPIPIRNHPAIEEAWREGRAAWTDDMPHDPRVDPATYARFPHQSDLFVPIRIKDRPVGGFFAIWWTARRGITPDEIGLLQGVSDLAGIFLENAQLYRQAAEANRAKDEFLATLSHELRNPLGAIATAVAALDPAGAADATTARLRDIIQRQTERLRRLLDDLLDVASVTAGKITLDRRPLDLGEAVAGCVRSLQERGRARAHVVTVRAQPVTVDADLIRLEQIVTNLVENALKFTEAGGEIHVEASREGEQAVLRVRDTGVGIAPETLPRVFELFVQGRQPLDRALGGLGVGLTLVRRLVEMHGGTIEVSSEGTGRGAEFVVRLPVAAAAAPPPPGPPARRRAAAPRRILLVEDNDDARTSLALALRGLGHEVIEAGDGTRGASLAVERRPDVVLIDLGLPGMDGYEVARAIRSHPAGGAPTLVAVTGYGQLEDRRRSRDAGFDAHMLKPVSLEALADLIAAPRAS